MHDLPPAHPINQRHRQHHSHHADQLIHDSHDERVNTTERFYINSSIFVRECIARELKEEINTTGD